MITAKVELYILALNKKTLSFDIVSLDKDNLVLPSQNLEKDSDINSTICSLFETYVDMSSTYCKYRLCDVSNQDNLIISYLILLPFGTSFKNCHILPSKQYEYKPNLQKIIKLL